MVNSPANDLDYLISRTTRVLSDRSNTFNKSNINKLTWCFNITACVWAVWDATGKAERNASWDAVVDAAFDAARSSDGGWDDAGHSPFENAWTATKVAAKALLLQFPARYYQLELNHTTDIDKTYQIAECMILVSMDKKYFRKIQTIVRDLPECEGISQTTLDRLHNNPWIKQYVELFEYG
jgi:hypothetical protein